MKSLGQGLPETSSLGGRREALPLCWCAICSVLGIDFSFSGLAKAWEHEEERGVPFPHLGLRVMSQSYCEPFLILHIWWEIEPRTLWSRDSCENESTLWAALGNASPPLLSLSPVTYRLFRVLITILKSSTCNSNTMNAQLYIDLIPLPKQKLLSSLFPYVSQEFCQLLSIFIKRFCSYQGDWFLQSKGLGWADQAILPLRWRKIASV